MLIAFAPSSALRDSEFFAGNCEIVDQIAGLSIVDHRSHWNRQLDRFTVATGPLAAFSMPPPLGRVFGIEPEMQQRVVVIAANHDYIAAVTAIAAARAAARHKLLTPECKTTVAAVAGFYPDLYFVDEQGGTGFSL